MGAIGQDAATLAILTVGTILGCVVSGFIMLKPTIAFYQTIAFINGIDEFFAQNAEYLPCLDTQSQFEPEIIKAKASDALSGSYNLAVMLMVGQIWNAAMIVIPCAFFLLLKCSFIENIGENTKYFAKELKAYMKAILLTF